MRCGRLKEQNNNQPTPGCFATLVREWSPCGDYFFVHDPVTDRTLDIPESFAPLNPFLVVGKILLGAVTLGTMAYVIVEREHKEFMFAYLTYWALAFQCLYHILSISNSILASAIAQPKFYVEGRVRYTWMIFNTSMAASIIVAAVWWGTIYDSDEKLDYEKIGPHGATLIAQYIDGFWINRIPIRFRHWWVTLLPFSLAYAFWTFLQGFVFDLENPDRTEEGEEDILYEDIDWDNDLTGTILVTVMLVFLAGPIVQILLFLLSLYHVPCLCMMDRRRYLDSVRTNEVRAQRQQDDDSLGDVYATR
mmetsp:Transcript_9980/g.19177  ORF Transcript_9980/g.19177 Transcript_9980/m.19177 type:complete len:306 (-) Transcript_9980:67-984(-)